MSLIGYDGQIELEDDDWLEDYDADDRGRDEDAWFCEFPDECLMPGRHMRSECYTRKMAEEWAEDAANNSLQTVSTVKKWL